MRTRSAPKPARARSDQRERPTPRRTQIRTVSTAKAGEKRRRAALVARLAALGVRCEIGPVLARAGAQPPCVGRIGGLHERRKRSGVGSVTHPANVIPACNPCNGWVEDVGNDRMVELIGTELAGWLVVRPGDPDWDRLARADDEHEIEPALCARCGHPYVNAPPTGRLPCGHVL